MLDEEKYLFLRRLRLRGNTDFLSGNPGFLTHNASLWRADGDIRRAERTPNIPPDNDPCPTKIALQTWKVKRVGGWAQAIFVAWRVAGSTGTQLTPVNSSLPPPIFLPSLGRKLLHFLDGFAYEEILISFPGIQDSFHTTLVCDGRMETSGASHMQ